MCQSGYIQSHAGKFLSAAQLLLAVRHTLERVTVVESGSGEDRGQALGWNYGPLILIADLAQAIM